MSAALSVIAVIMHRLFPCRTSAIIVADFVMTCFVIQLAMLLPFWQDCAIAFFVIYAFKEACISACFIGKTARLPYCVSGIIHLLCALEVAFSFAFYAYANYETIMVMICLAKIASMIELRIFEGRTYYAVH
jgi:hypothetical protein